MKVLVCGGRRYADRARVFAELDALALSENPPRDAHGNWVPMPGFTVIHGGAGAVVTKGGEKIVLGADLLAREWAVCNWVKDEGFLPDWDAHGLAAGPIRNRRMLEEGKPDLVLAFPGGKGTADMVRQATVAGVRVIEVKE